MTMLNQIGADLELLFADVGMEATYVSKGTQAVNTATGAVTSSDTEVSVTLLRDAFTAREMLAAGGEVLLEDLKFYIRKASLDTVPVVPKKTDQVTIGSDTYEVFYVKTDPTGLLYMIGVRK